MSRVKEKWFDVERSLHEFILDSGRIHKEVSERDIDLTSPLFKFYEGGKSKIYLKTPILSAAMKAVTGPQMAIAMAMIGGAGVIYSSQFPEDQADMVREVKKYKAGFVIPDVFSPDDLLDDVQRLIDTTGHSTLPITADGQPNGELVGYLTENDFYIRKHSGLRVRDRMVKVEDIVFARLEQILDEDGNEDLNIANEMLLDSHHGSLPIVDDDMGLKYVVFRKDARENLENPYQMLDEKKRYIVGAALNTHDYHDDDLDRARILANAEVDFFVIDTSQALSDYVADTIEYLKERHSKIPVIAGNVINEKGFRFLAENSVDGIKIGMGSGSICITQEQIRVGSGQANALYRVSKARKKWLEEEHEYIPLISDGGVRTAGDITIALVFGADSVMAGGYLAGTDESNSPVLTKTAIIDGRTVDLRIKEYWGEGHSRSKEWREKRYGHTSFDEGFVTEVPYVGPLKTYLTQPLSMIRQGIRKAGCRNIEELHEKAEPRLVSDVSQRMSQEKISVARKST